MLGSFCLIFHVVLVLEAADSFHTSLMDLREVLGFVCLFFMWL